MGRRPTGRKPITFRTDAAALIDEAAAQSGLERARWLEAIVDRALEGAGLMSRQERTERAAARARAER